MLKKIIIGVSIAILLLTVRTPITRADFGDFEVAIPGFSGSIDAVAQSGFVAYINKIFQLFMALIVVAGVIAVVVGGYLYMTAGGNGGQVETAKTWIKSALFGIVLALASYLILNTINPQLASELQNPLCQDNDDCQSPYICKDGLCQDPG